MKLIHDSTPCLLHLLVLAELFGHSSSRPATPSVSHICTMFVSTIHQLDRLVNLSKKLHDLTGDELAHIAAMENRLDSLPHMQHTAVYFSSLKMNESLSQLYVYAHSFKLHVDWLKRAKENATLPSGSAEGASTHLQQLSNSIKSLHQISEETPLPPSPSLPAASTAFDVLKFSVEISERMEVFCKWAKQMLRLLQKKSRCPRH